MSREERRWSRDGAEEPRWAVVSRDGPIRTCLSPRRRGLRLKRALASGPSPRGKTPRPSPHRIRSRARPRASTTRPRRWACSASLRSDSSTPPPVQPRDVAEMQLRCSRDVAEMEPVGLVNAAAAAARTADARDTSMTRPRRVRQAPRTWWQRAARCCRTERARPSRRAQRRPPLRLRWRRLLAASPGCGSLSASGLGRRALAARQVR